MPRAARLTAPRTVELFERPPLRPGPDEVLVRVEFAGVCGTDLALFSGDYPVPLPLVLGHEFVGVVADIGPGVSSGLKGTRIVGEINATCVAYRKSELCSACEAGMPSHCMDRTVVGIVRRDGAFAEEMLLPAGSVHAVPEGVDPLVATLTEPLAAAIQTFEMTPIQPGELVVVLGAGRLGALIGLAATVRGARVLAVSRSEAKRTRALELGVEEALPPADADDWVRNRTSGVGAPVVVDATGDPEGIQLALRLVRPRGTIAAKTTCGLPAQGLDMTRLVVDEVRIQGSRCGPFRPALELLASRQALLGMLISSIHPLSEITPALEAAGRESKVVIRPD